MRTPYLPLAVSLGLAGVALFLIFSTTAGWATGEANAALAQPTEVREFVLTAQEVDWEIFPGTVVRAWTYNGTVPGPELRVTEGDLVRVTLRNELPVPTTIHWHGIDVPNGMDGVPGVTQEAVEPGGSFVYEFTATNPGTRWYHSHQDGEIQLPLGLYGSFIVEPRVQPQGAVAYDREYTYVLSEWSLALTPDVALGNASLPTSGRGAPHSKQLDFDLFLMTGKVHDAIAPIELKEGERVRIRLINAGQLVHTMHSHGHSFKVVATDGNFVPPEQQLLKDSVSIGPSERVDIEIMAHNPGVWMFHCHMQHHGANGMMTTIRYEGVAPPVGEHEHAAPAAAPPTASSAPVATAPAAHASGNATVVMADNRFQPANLSVAVGTTVTWPNNGANIHTVSAMDGSFESGSITAGGSFSHTFTAVGQYQYVCRQHLLNGMRGTITVH